MSLLFFAFSFLPCSHTSSEFRRDSWQVIRVVEPHELGRADDSLGEQMKKLKLSPHAQEGKDTHTLLSYAQDVLINIIICVVFSKQYIFTSHLPPLLLSPFLLLSSSFPSLISLPFGSLYPPHHPTPELLELPTKTDHTDGGAATTHEDTTSLTPIIVSTLCHWYVSG